MLNKKYILFFSLVLQITATASSIKLTESKKEHLQQDTELVNLELIPVSLGSISIFTGLHLVGLANLDYFDAQPSGDKPETFTKQMGVALSIKNEYTAIIFWPDKQVSGLIKWQLTYQSEELHDYALEDRDYLTRKNFAHALADIKALRKPFKEKNYDPSSCISLAKQISKVSELKRQQKEALKGQETIAFVKSIYAGK